MGKKTGDKFNVTLTPDKGYGERDERLVQKILRLSFKARRLYKLGCNFK